MGCIQRFLVIAIAWASLRVDCGFLHRQKAKTTREKEPIQTVIRNIENVVKHFLHLDHNTTSEAHDEMEVEKASLKDSQQSDHKKEVDHIEKLLLVVPVGSKPESLDLFMSNVNHLRKEYTGHVDVLAMHYETPDSSWMSRHTSWFKKNVLNSTHRPGIKIPLTSKAIHDFQQISTYSWIWLMDDDIDITQTDMQYLLSLADESGSPLVGPAIRFPPGVDAGPGVGRAEARLQELAGSSNLSSSHGRYGCQPDEWLCQYQTAHPDCRFSYTTFVEVMAPLFRPQALWHILHECEDCFSDNSVWGIDFIWCSQSAKLYGLPRNRGCALIDQGAVIHNNIKSLPKYGHGGDEVAHKINQENDEQYRKVHKRYKKDFAKPWDSGDSNDTSWKPVCVH